MFDPIVIKFESTKTPNEIYRLVIDSMEKAVDVASMLADASELRQLELDLSELLARVRGMQSRAKVGL